MVRPLSPPPPLMTVATRRPPGRRRSESPEFPPVPSCSRDLPAAAPVTEARRRSGNDATGGAAPRTGARSAISGESTSRGVAGDSGPHERICLWAPNPSKKFGHLFIDENA